LNNQTDTYYFKEINDRELWNTSLAEFTDANIYQLWNYANVVQNERHVKHLAFYSANNLIGLAQVRIKQFPILRCGIAYIFRGPVWLKKNQKPNIEVLINILQLLKQEYVEKNNLLLRFRPFIYSDNDYSLKPIQNSLYNSLSEPKSYKTVVLYLDKDLEDIRKNFKQKWRNCLNQSERKDLTVIRGHNKQLYNDFLELYDDMIKRKKFREYVDPRAKGRLINEFGSESKLVIFIAYKDQIPVSALVGTAMGNTGIYLLGATNKPGLQNRASYLLQWEMIKWLKENKIARYDLGGIDPEDNPGVYKFKTGITNYEIEDIGALEIYHKRYVKIFISIIGFLHVIRKNIYSRYSEN